MRGCLLEGRQVALRQLKLASAEQMRMILPLRVRGRLAPQAISVGATAGLAHGPAIQRREARLPQTDRLGKRGMSPIICTQGNASSQNISRAGVIDFASSRVPTLRTTMPGLVPGSWAIDEPHSGQKCRSIGFPLPPGLVKVFVVPSNINVSLGTYTRAPNAQPVNFWQSRQWHTPDVTGSAVVE